MRRLGRKCSAQFPLNGSLAFLLGPGGHSRGAGKATLNWRLSGGLVLLAGELGSPRMSSWAQGFGFFL